MTVAVLSTGVDYNHEDIRANILVNLKEAEIKKPGETNPTNDADEDGNGYKDDIVGYDFVEGHGLPYDRIGAGTAAAGIIGAVHDNGKGVRGVASKVSLIPVKYIGANGVATLPDLVAALKYAATKKPDLVYLHLANISFAKGKGHGKIDISGAEKSALTEVFGELASQSIPVIVSAGNSGVDLSTSGKAAIRAIANFPNAFVVTSVDSEDRRPFIANYSKELVQTSAPGTKILTTLPGNQYGEVSGTFASAAYVTGAVALAVSVHYGHKTSAQVLAALIDSRGSDALPENLQHETLGGNRLNVSKFLKLLEQN